LGNSLIAPFPKRILVGKLITFAISKPFRRKPPAASRFR
jgi:hypothetical protein